MSARLRSRLPQIAAELQLGVYAKVIASKTDHGHALDDLIGTVESAPIGTSGPVRAPAA